MDLPKNRFILGRENGFSLVELMIVIGIISILATVVMPKLQGFMAKSKQVEAKNALRQLDTLQQSYFDERGDYGSEGEIGFSFIGKHYEFDRIHRSETGRYYGLLQLGPGKSLCTGVTTDPWGIFRDEAAAFPQGVPVELLNAGGSSPVQSRCQ